MSGSDALALGMTQRVQHAVVGMDGRKTVLVQLILDNVNELLHPSVVVRPVTDDLTTTTTTHQHNQRCQSSTSTYTHNMFDISTFDLRSP